jgi:hypothetical protein
MRHNASARAMRAAIVLTFASAVLTPFRSRAQQPSATTAPRTPVVVALVGALPDGYSGAVVLRRPTAPSNVILMTLETATARQLSAAVLTLATLVELQGAHPSEHAAVKVIARQGPAAWIETEERRAESLVRRLKRSQVQYLPGLGIVQHVEFTMSTVFLRSRLTPAPMLSTPTAMMARQR